MLGIEEGHFRVFQYEGTLCFLRALVTLGFVAGTHCYTVSPVSLTPHCTLQRDARP